MDATSGSVKRLTYGSGDSSVAQWSSDGARIVFQSTRDGIPEIYVMSADGKDQNVLTRSAIASHSARLSYDGRMLAYVRSSETGDRIMRMALDGTGQPHSAHVDLGAGIDPDWSPDGNTVAYVRQSREGEVVAVPVDGGPTRTLFKDPSRRLRSPVYSPDGKSVAFWAEARGTAEIWVMNADGSGARNLTPGKEAGKNFEPRWSPDGTRILFSSTRNHGVRTDLYVMQADGSNVTAVTRANGEDGYASWSADGRAVYFTSFRDGNPEIYRQRLDDDVAERLTNHHGFDGMALERPQRAGSRNPSVGINLSK